MKKKIYRVKTIFRHEHFHKVSAANEEEAIREAHAIACEENASEVIWYDSEAELLDGKHDVDN